MIARIGKFVGALIAGAWGALTSTVAFIFTFVENWLFDSKKAQYGLSVTRMLFGVTALGLLASNFSTRLYTFGSGAAWNGELGAAVSDFPKIWIFSTFRAVMGNDIGLTLMYILLAVLAVLIIVGWRFRIVHPIFFVLWIGFIESNDMVGDQGDNMFRIAMLILFFADPASRWSFDARRREKKEWFAEGSSPRQIGTVLHNLSLIGILSFHLAIGLFMGLPWFSLTMIAIDAIFISDKSWKRFTGSIGDKWRGSSPVVLIK